MVPMPMGWAFILLPPSITKRKINAKEPVACGQPSKTNKQTQPKNCIWKLGAELRNGRKTNPKAATWKAADVMGSSFLDLMLLPLERHTRRLFGEQLNVLCPKIKDEWMFNIYSKFLS